MSFAHIAGRRREAQAAMIAARLDPTLGTVVPPYQASVSQELEAAKLEGREWFTHSLFPERLLSVRSGGQASFVCYHGELLEQPCVECPIDVQMIPRPPKQRTADE